MSEAAAASTTTWGMRLDAFLSQMDSTMVSIDNLSSTQLYGLIVVVTAVVSFSILGFGNNECEYDAVGELHKAPQQQTTTTNNNSSSSSKKNSSYNKRKEPKWFVLKYLNYVAALTFVASIGMFSWNAQAILKDPTTLLQFLMGWSVFLCYFLGFFGISFVDPDDLFASDNAAASVTTTTTSSTTTTTAPAKQQQQQPKKVIVPPAPCAPVCSDPKSKTVSKLGDLSHRSDHEICQLVLSNQLKDHQLESKLDTDRAVVVRRLVIAEKLAQVNCSGLENLPSQPSLDYSRVHGANCEVVVGYVPIPVGMVGPLTLNGESVYIPMATTEGCLVASTQRGAKAISSTPEGATCIILKDGITRAPCLRFPSAKDAAEMAKWVMIAENFRQLKKAFESTTSFGKLLKAEPTVAGRNVYLRMVCFSGDAMGMNMVSKGSLAVIDFLRGLFPSLELIALSGNMCTDKKAAATNWLEGRGKSVVVEAIIPRNVVETTLKTTVKAMVETNIQKCLVGSAMAGSLGGFNAHASNIVTAVFLATGQDPAQNVESSQCITLLEETNNNGRDDGGDLWISCTMPALEVGTVGGGTSLPAQHACLECMGVAGGNREEPGKNAKKLATMVAGATMAGELSLLAALAANTLVQAHMKHNRK